MIVISNSRNFHLKKNDLVLFQSEQNLPGTSTLAAKMRKSPPDLREREDNSLDSWGSEENISILLKTKSVFSPPDI